MQVRVLDRLVFRETLAGFLRVAVIVVGTVVAATQTGDGPQIALIPTLIALGAKRFFGDDKGDPSEALADNPAVAFVLGALTSGDTEGVDELVDPHAAVYANGYTIIDPDGGDSPAQFTANVAFWRSQVPDLAICVYDEMVDKHRHKQQDVAVRLVMTGTPRGAEGAFEVEGAAFVKVDHGKAVEWRLIIDSQVVEELLASIARDEVDE